jgi:hypothetical protein
LGPLAPCGEGLFLAGEAENLRLGDMPLFIQGVEPVVLERRHLSILMVLSISESRL